MVNVKVILQGVHIRGKSVDVGAVIEITKNHYNCNKTRFELVNVNVENSDQRSKIISSDKPRRSRAANKNGRGKSAS